MSDDLDIRLRNLAPGVRPRDEFRQNLRMVLRSQMPEETAPSPPRQRQRQHRLLALMAAMFVLTIMVGDGGQQLGSYDFELVRDEQPGAEFHQLISPVEKVGFRSPRDMPIEKYREIYALRAAAMRQLTGATGWTVGDATCFQADYVYEVDGELTTISDVPEDSPDGFTEEMVTFLATHMSFCLDTVDAGQATELPPEVVAINGMPVKMRKWLIAAPDGTQAVYWEGSPE